MTLGVGGPIVHVNLLLYSLTHAPVVEVLPPFQKEPPSACDKVGSASV